jgi:hypothetical protein
LQVRVLPDAPYYIAHFLTICRVGSTPSLVAAMDPRPDIETQWRDQQIWFSIYYPFTGHVSHPRSKEYLKVVLKTSGFIYVLKVL